ncbi:hypothetical protein PP178_03945 [Zeaxanthinibacter sp. PT1]|uniref:hypothetical protein n=1 Tax=Zeaxanthinibacter TaxID=561554 RepID=UPI00234AA156|nr:hypothetical protein [Zeaxanthinibacter sp. PT1]MDC6350692.1 hypothetical protein [Zeaxanthinibacter sp. PT1]
MKYLVNLDLNKNQLLNAALQNLASHPSSPVVGQIYWNTTDDVAYAWDGSQWLNPFQDTIYNHPTFTALDPTLSGANVLASLETNTEGHITAATTRVLTLSDLGYTGATDANKYVHPTDGVDMGPALTGATVISDVTVNAEGHVIGFATRNMTASDLGAAVIDDAANNLTHTWSSSKIQAELDNISSQVAGALIYIGGYDAATNTPDLDTTPSGIEKGNTFTVTADGMFYSASVQAGDMLIAEVDNPASLADWTVVNKNIPDIVDASTTDKGIIEIATQAEVDAGTDTVRAVTPATLSSYVAEAISGGAFAASVGDGSNTSFNVTHGLGTEDCLVEVYDAVTKETVITDVDRLSTSQVQIRVNVAPATNALRVVIRA